MDESTKRLQVHVQRPKYVRKRWFTQLDLISCRKFAFLFIADIVLQDIIVENQLLIKSLDPAHLDTFAPVDKLSQSHQNIFAH